MTAASILNRKSPVLIFAWTIAFAVLCGILCLFFGPIGIFYASGIIAFQALANTITKLVRPNPDVMNDPAYRKNVQDLIDRQRRPEGQSE